MNTQGIRRYLHSILHDPPFGYTTQSERDLKRQFAVSVFTQVIKCLDYIDELHELSGNKDPLELIKSTKHMRDTLFWYAEQCQKVGMNHQEGDAARLSLHNDGGKRALEAALKNSGDYNG